MRPWKLAVSPNSHQGISEERVFKSDRRLQSLCDRSALSRPLGSLESASGKLRVSLGMKLRETDVYRREMIDWKIGAQLFYPATYR